MKKFTISGNTFHVMDELKTILPSRAWQKWKFVKKNRSWVLVLQSSQSTKKFEKALSTFCNKNNIHLSLFEWDGFNKEDNYA